MFLNFNYCKSYYQNIYGGRLEFSFRNLNIIIQRTTSGINKESVYCIILDLLENQSGKGELSIQLDYKRIIMNKEN